MRLPFRRVPVYLAELFKCFAILKRVIDQLVAGITLFLIHSPSIVTYSLAGCGIHWRFLRRIREYVYKWAWQKKTGKKDHVDGGNLKTTRYGSGICG